MSHKPQFNITPATLNRMIEIRKKVTEMKYDRIELSPRLKHINRIRAIHATLAIEGNSLSLEEVAAIIDGMESVGPLEEIDVVTNEMMIDYTDSIENE